MITEVDLLTCTTAQTKQLLSGNYRLVALNNANIFGVRFQIWIGTELLGDYLATKFNPCNVRIPLGNYVIKCFDDDTFVTNCVAELLIADYGTLYVYGHTIHAAYASDAIFMSLANVQSLVRRKFTQAYGAERELCSSFGAIHNVGVYKYFTQAMRWVYLGFTRKATVTIQYFDGTWKDFGKFEPYSPSPSAFMCMFAQSTPRIYRFTVDTAVPISIGHAYSYFGVTDDTELRI